MNNIRFFLSENFQFLVVRFSIYLNRRVCVMLHGMSNPVFWGKNKKNIMNFSSAELAMTKRVLKIKY